MDKLINNLIISLIYLGYGNILIQADDPKTPPKVKVEFRRVEQNPGEGLTEAIDPSTSEKIYLHKKVELDNSDIASARYEFYRFQEIDNHNADISFTKEGAKKIEALTKQLQRKKLAILLDGKVVMAPTIMAPLTSGAVICCKSKAEADRIVQALNSK